MNLRAAAVGPRFTIELARESEYRARAFNDLSKYSLDITNEDSFQVPKPFAPAKSFRGPTIYVAANAEKMNSTRPVTICKVYLRMSIVVAKSGGPPCKS